MSELDDMERELALLEAGGFLDLGSNRTPPPTLRHTSNYKHTPTQTSYRSFHRYTLELRLGFGLGLGLVD